MTTTLPRAHWRGEPGRGADIGRPDKPAQHPNIARKFSLRRIPIDRGGYDRGGAYWGIGAPLYWASWEGVGADCAIEFFFRARDRTAAKLEVIRRHPAATFFN